MKHCIVLLWLSVLSCGVSGQSEKHIFGDSLCHTFASPWLLRQGTEISIQCDSVYLINPLRYRMYRQLHHYLLEETQPSSSALIQAYDQALSDSYMSYDALKQQYERTDVLSRQWIAESRQLLQHIQQRVDHTEQLLSQTDTQLHDAKKALKSARKKQVFQYMIAGAAGIGAGFLLARW